MKLVRHFALAPSMSPSFDMVPMTRPTDAIHNGVQEGVNGCSDANANGSPGWSIYATIHFTHQDKCNLFPS